MGTITDRFRPTADSACVLLARKHLDAGDQELTHSQSSRLLQTGIPFHVIGLREGRYLPPTNAATMRSDECPQ